MGCGCVTNERSLLLERDFGTVSVSLRFEFELLVGFLRHFPAKRKASMEKRVSRLGDGREGAVHAFGICSTAACLVKLQSSSAGEHLGKG